MIFHISFNKLLSLILVLACISCSKENNKSSTNFNEEGDWRSSALLIDSEYFNYFEDSLKNVRNALNFSNADSSMRNAILQHENFIPTEKLIEILKLYESDFGASGSCIS